eukprot:6173032-Pleurochrysis_carterae.AAC.4
MKTTTLYQTYCTSNPDVEPSPTPSPHHPQAQIMRSQGGDSNVAIKFKRRLLELANGCRTVVNI